MKAGETALLLVEVGIENISLVESIIFTFINEKKRMVQKRYPDEVRYIEGKFQIPLSQQDTENLRGHFSLEAQINFNNLSVVKSDIYEGFASSTLATTLIDNNTPDGQEEEVNLSVDSIVVYAGGEGGGSGENGATFYPFISADGTLSWSNDRGLSNPAPVNIKGEKGNPGYTPQKGIDYFDGQNGHTPNITIGTVTTLPSGSSAAATITGTSENPVLNIRIPKGADGSDGQDLVHQGEVITPTNGTVTLTIEPNKKYLVNGAVSSLNLTAPGTYNAWDEFYIMFTTSASGCTVTAPAGWRYAEGSTSSFEADKLYEWDAVAGLIVCPNGTAVS